MVKLILGISEHLVPEEAAMLHVEGVAERMLGEERAEELRHHRGLCDDCRILRRSTIVEGLISFFESETIYLQQYDTDVLYAAL